MTYDQWADAYSQSAQLAKGKVEALENRLKKTRNTWERLEIEKRLKIQYDMYIDCVSIEKMMIKRASIQQKQEVWQNGYDRDHA